MGDAPEDVREDVTQVLEQLRNGDQRAADKLLPLVYDEFRALARHYLQQERMNHTLQPTALVHEAYMKLVDQTRVDWQGKSHFFAVAAQAMRRILVEQARRKGRVKRGGGLHKVDLAAHEPAGAAPAVDVLTVDEALTRFAAGHPEKAELVKLRYFVGMTLTEAAAALGVSTATAERHWRFARAWLARALGPAALAE